MVSIPNGSILKLPQDRQNKAQALPHYKQIAFKYKREQRKATDVQFLIFSLLFTMRLLTGFIFITAFLGVALSTYKKDDYHHGRNYQGSSNRGNKHQGSEYQHGKVHHGQGSAHKKGIDHHKGSEYHQGSNYGCRSITQEIS